MISTIVDFKMSAIFILKKRAAKKHKFFISLKSRYFVMGGPIDLNVGLFWETSAGFLSIVLQLCPKYGQLCQFNNQK